MRCTALKRAARALLASAVLLAASTVTTTMAQSSEGCVSYDSSSVAGEGPDGSIAEATYFGCEDSGFLVAVQASSQSAVYPLDALSWTCSGGDVIGSFSSEHSAEDSILFTVGITQVQTSVEDGEDFPYLGDMYIGGYDVKNIDAGMLFSWKGPLGDFDDDDVVLPGTLSTSCGDNAFATGVTVWSSDYFVYGVILECADVTSTCAPPNYPMGLLGDGSSSSVGTATIVGASVGGVVLLLAIVVGVTCCVCRGRGMAAPRLHQPPPTVVAVASTAKTERGAGASTKQGIPTPRSGPPPPYVERVR